MYHPVEILAQRLHEEQLWEKTIHLDRKEYLVRAGSLNANVYFVESGSMHIYVSNPEEESTIRFGYKGSIITALDCFITDEPTKFYIQAIKKTVLKMISKNKYLEFINADPDNLALWNELLQQLVQQQLEREQDLLLSSPAERYRRVLERSPRLFQEIPAKYIASYLRMTPETLSRLKKS